MSLIKFNNDDNIISVSLSSDSTNHIKIVFPNKDIVPNEQLLLNGFKELNEHNHIEQSDFSDMNHIYREFDDGLTYILTNVEDDVYVEPIPSEPPYQKPMPDYSPTIDEVKQSKMSSLSHICNSMIIDGISLDIDGTMEHFSYTEEDQTNIKELFDLAVQTNVPLYYHSDGNSCKLYTVEQIIELYTTSAMNKMHHITYFNQLKMYIGTLDDIDAINVIEYGYELSGEYLDTYKAAMEQAKIGMETLLKW